MYKCLGTTKLNIINSLQKYKGNLLLLVMYSLDSMIRLNYNKYTDNIDCRYLQLFLIEIGYNR